MTDFRLALADLRRPRLLIRAARHGLADYRRDRDLRRLIGTTPEAATATLPRLWVEEERMEDIRRSGHASYSISRHIDLLIALMAEVRLTARPV